MHVVAEGVEDSTDWNFVRDAGCELVQGYFVSPPMPPGALLGWVNRWESYAGELVVPASLTEVNV